MCQNAVKFGLTGDFLGKNRDPATIGQGEPCAGVPCFGLAHGAQHVITGTATHHQDPDHDSLADSLCRD
jgi:hypothetical protein